MKHCVKVLFFAALAGVLCGCNHIEAAIEMDSHHSHKQKNELPVKFYLKELAFCDPDVIFTPDDIDKKIAYLQAQQYSLDKGGAGIANMRLFGSIFKHEEIEKLRAALLTGHPEIFSKSPKNALNCSIFIFNDSKIQEQNFFLNQICLGLPSFFTLGLLPWKAEHTMPLIIKFRIEEFTRSYTLKLLIKERSNAGILGIFGTRFCLEPIKNAWFEKGYYMDNVKPYNLLIIKDEHKNAFANLIVSKLCDLSNEELQKYFSQKTETVNLLD